MTPPDPEPIQNWAASHTTGLIQGEASITPRAALGSSGAGAGPVAGIWLNGTGVAIAGQGIAILGAAGRGKSSLALSLIALGGVLIADDGLWLAPHAAPPKLMRPAQSPDLIEARGVGLIRVGRPVAEAALALVVDLDRAETERLPPPRQVSVGACLCPLILGAGNPSLAPALMLLVRHGRAAV